MITMLYILLIPVFILVALALYIFSGGMKLSSATELIIGEVLRDDLPGFTVEIIAHIEASTSPNRAQNA